MNKWTDWMWSFFYLGIHYSKYTESYDSHKHYSTNTEDDFMLQDPKNNNKLLNGIDLIPPIKSHLLCILVIMREPLVKSASVSRSCMHNKLVLIWLCSLSNRSYPPSCSLNGFTISLKVIHDIQSNLFSLLGYTVTLLQAIWSLGQLFSPIQQACPLQFKPLH